MTPDPNLVFKGGKLFNDISIKIIPDAEYKIEKNRIEQDSTE